MKDYSFLLDRPEHNFYEGKINAALAGQRVMITGAGGSIGSALAHRIYASPASAIGLVGHSEAPIFNLLQSMPSHPDRLDYAIADIGDAGAMGKLFKKWQPDVVLHAAAHKHVGLMESQAREAFRNNTEATLQLAAQAMASQSVRKFVFISTDKAVSPSCVMGASKRLAEVLLLKRHAPFVTVCRFGNVLGSAGSLVEIVETRIKERQTVFVTDPKMKRFFITAKEAVGLVMTAGLLGYAGDLFTLDMGTPILIMDIIDKLSPRHPVQYEITQAGAGEKLNEELLNPGEQFELTDTSGVLRVVYPSVSDAEAALAQVLADPASIVKIVRPL